MAFDFSIVSASLSVANFELGQLWRAYHIFDGSIDKEIESFQSALARDEGKPCSEREDERVNDEYGELLDLGRINNFSGVVMAYAVLERFFLDVFNSARLEIFNLVGQDETSLTLKGYLKELKKLNIDLEREPFDYSALRRFNSARNAIMHAGGHTLGKWIDGQYVPGEQITITADEVKGYINLVGQTCHMIANQYETLAHAFASATDTVQ